jgi:hypothetical protein
LEEAEKQHTKLLRKVAEKDELKAVAKHFEKLIKNLHSYIKNKFSLVEDTDDAMLSKKPLTGFKCASCEKHLRNLSSFNNGQGVA